MGTILESLRRLLGKEKKQDREQALADFMKRYGSFKNLLQANSDLAKILAELEQVANGDRGMDVQQVRHSATQAIACAKTMSESLSGLSGGGYKQLAPALRTIAQRIEAELEEHAPGDVTQLTLSLTDIDSTMAYVVGGKNANLGEMANMLELPVPRGFAVTVQAGRTFLSRYSGLFDFVHKELLKIDVDKAASIDQASRRIVQAILDAPMPKQLEDELLKAYDVAFGGRRVRVALRSSAISEDGMQSFAGQYSSILGVTRDTLIQAWKEVFASLYSPRAIAYRARNGFELHTSGMGMCCIEMINAKAAGVAFSRHPVDLR
ncbi:MAG: PEP/pyruvate-binding domain-containing protein, partial [Desulfovibrio sp.]|nr:PEP/pyruvate-binding domain-containing protein [Desulfovibrio sp.]